MSGDSSRKPSGSSTHSGTHSPPSASGNVRDPFLRVVSLSIVSDVQPSRKLPSSPASNLYGMGGGNGSNGLKALNAGWQVWGSTTPSSKRNASMSSLASVGGGEMQSNVGEVWNASRSASGTWDDNALKKDFSSLVCGSCTFLNVRQPRQRQSHISSFPPSRVVCPTLFGKLIYDFQYFSQDDRPSGSKNPHINVGKDPHPPRYSASTKSLGPGTYPGPHPSFPLPGLGYDSGVADNDLSLPMRGMVVEDDLAALHARQQVQSSMPIPAQVSNSQMRALPPQRSVYNTYPTTEYGFYPPARDSFVDYPYVGYGNPDLSLYASSGVPMSPVLYPSGPQNLHPTNMDIRQQQPAVYFDYNSATRPPSNFYFPPQPMMYPPPHSPLLSSQLPTSPVTLAEKKVPIFSSFEPS
ncbi:hypothetical protein B0H11DRAFT_1742114 [Mycena galericulata]|nr:hypothetical protein B0H11DRAFT_1742114 [Mycena galericulata]